MGEIMIFNLLQRFLALFKSEPGPESIAQQLRKPSGDLAREVGESMNKANEPLFDLTLQVMQPEENDRILEIGFGTGKFFEKLFAFEDTLQISGIDYSEEMVESAKRLNADFIAGNKLDIQWGESDALPFADHSFDKVFCNNVIYFWEEPARHLGEIYRVLKPGGTFYTGIRDRESMLVFPFVEYGFHLYETGKWKNILAQNGFRFLEVRTASDPPMNFNGDELQLESCCIAARKEMLYP